MTKEIKEYSDYDEVKLYNNTCVRCEAPLLEMMGSMFGVPRGWYSVMGKDGLCKNCTNERKIKEYDAAHPISPTP